MLCMCNSDTLCLFNQCNVTRQNIATHNKFLVLNPNMSDKKNTYSFLKTESYISLPSVLAPLHILFTACSPYQRCI